MKQFDQRSSHKKQKDEPAILANDEPNFHWDDGRLRVSNVAYMLPKDLGEIQRLDFQHYLLRYAFKGNHLAPVKQPQNILDVACGTGRWMYEMAQTFPQASLVGIDMVTPQSLKSNLNFPRQCMFKQGNVAQGLPFVHDSFDFVHQRLLILGLQATAWPPLLQNLIRVTRPGGWIELVESDLICRRLGPQTARLGQWVHEISVRRGVDPSYPQRLGLQMQQMGLVNVSMQKVSIPLGRWGGHIGSMMLQDMMAVIKATRSLVSAYAGISPEEYDRMTGTIFKEFEQYRSYSNFYVAYGQRPTS
ncbi:hypothetical protein KDH_69770 [Dictyobacter sp. S3.2.2.5]|uniref:Methyltransferase domain-containing protein n=1 Tax=Dictyobacter halimunensis TaxID=3026934 RepID=A0ABQ6G0X1_9CHLR|nr:hypothetical protein KDH_69770 [Dictyobacter sp. S3.2.2.5]